MLRFALEFTLGFSPLRKRPGPIQDFSFLPRGIALAPEPLPFRRYFFLQFERSYFEIVFTTFVEPGTQHLQPETDIYSDPAMRSPARLDQTQGLCLKFFVELLL